MVDGGYHVIGVLARSAEHLVNETIEMDSEFQRFLQQMRCVARKTIGWPGA